MIADHADDLLDDGSGETGELVVGQVEVEVEIEIRVSRRHGGRGRRINNERP